MRRWLFDVWAWLLANFGGCDGFVARGRLVLLTDEDFPVEDLTGHELAEDYLGFVREHSAVPDSWQLSLLPESADETQDELELLQIPYRADTLGNPELLVAQLAIGVSHHLVASIGEPAPGAAESAHGYAVDVGAVFFGFGTFVANSSASMARWGYGESTQVLGEREVCYALAIFAWLLQIRDELVLAHLHDNPSAFYAAAVRDLRHQGTDLTRLRNTKRLREGPYR